MNWDGKVGNNVEAAKRYLTRGGVCEGVWHFWSTRFYAFLIKTRFKSLSSVAFYSSE